MNRNFQLLFVFVGFIIAALFVQRVSAQSCSGGPVTCGGSEARRCRYSNGNICIQGTDGCVCTWECGGTTWTGNSCSSALSNYGQCGAGYACLGVGSAICVISGSCYWTAIPTSTPVPGTTPPPVSGGCTSGDCFTGIANCGAVGRDPGSGTCSGGLCCIPKSSYVMGCPYHPSGTSSCWDSALGRDRDNCTYCAYNEGNGCPCSICSGCATGLVNSGGVCSCPGCNISFTPNTVSVPLGGFVDVTMNNHPPEWGPTWLYSYSNAGIATAQKLSSPHRIRITGNALGSTIVSVIAWWGGYSPRTLCSSNISVAVNPPPTLPNCPALGTITPSSTCAHSVTGGGSMRWDWPQMNGVTSYEIVVSNTSGTVIQPQQIISSTTLNCGSGTCSYTQPGLVAGSYLLSVRPIVSSSCVVPSNPTVSAAAAVGVCPANQIRVVAKGITGTATNCTDVVASTTFINPVTFTLAPPLSPVSQTQSGSTPVTWNSMAPNMYTLTDSPPSDAALKFACWTKTGGAPYSSGIAARVESAETLTWYMGYSIGRSWGRVVDGDAIVCRNVFSPISATMGANRFFMTNNTNGMPGVVSYGSNFDFDGSPTADGRQYVSSKNWLVQEQPETICQTNWYQYLINRYGVSGAPNDYAGGIRPQTDFPSRLQPYKVVGDLTTSGNWNLSTDNTNIVIFVNGNLTINGEIKVPSKSFIAFVVNGNITVNPSVGTTAVGTTPSVEGVFITSPTGQFITSATTNVTTPKLIVNGIVVAGGFLLQRDLDLVGANTTTPSDEFRYNPLFLLTMPNEFMDTKILWGEVNP